MVEQRTFNAWVMDSSSIGDTLIVNNYMKYTNDMKYNSHFVSKNPKDILSELVSKGER